MHLENNLEEEYFLDENEINLITTGINNGLERFYIERDNRTHLVTEKNYLSRQRTAYVNDAIYSLAKKSTDSSITVELKNAGISYEYVLLTFNKRNIKVTFSPVENLRDLPDYSEYRSNLAFGNSPFDPQLSLFLDPEPKNIYKSLIVTYNGKNGPTPNFILIGATNPQQDKWIYLSDLTKGTKSVVTNDRNQTSPVMSNGLVEKETLNTEIPIVKQGSRLTLKPTLKNISTDKK